MRDRAKEIYEDVKERVRSRYCDEPVVDLLGDLACSSEEAARRKASRNFRNLLSAMVELGYSPRGIGSTRDAEIE